MIHDSGIAPEILDLARKEAVFIETDTNSARRSQNSHDISDRISALLQSGNRIIWLCGGDPTRLPGARNALAACDIAGHDHRILPAVSLNASYGANIRNLDQQGKAA